MNILLIEDEADIAKVVRRGLEQSHYSVDSAADGRQGLELALAKPYSVIVLDIMLPGLDGWKICEELRSRRDRTPILMLTARASIPDRVRGLEIGADDYLSKPFDFAELLARIQALLRRDKIHKTRVIQIADLEVDTGLRRVSRAGKEIVLSVREYMLLEALVTREGQVLTREVVQERVWLEEECFSNVVDVYIGLLRKKIDAEHRVKLIHTIRGLGYMLRRPRTEEGL